MGKGQGWLSPTPFLSGLASHSLLTRLEVGKGPKGQGSPMGSGSGSREGLAEVHTCPWPFSNPLLCGHLRHFLPSASSCAGNGAQAFGQARALPLSGIPSLSFTF